MFAVGESMHLKIEGCLFLAHDLHEEVGVIAVELSVVGVGVYFRLIEAFLVITISIASLVVV